MVLGLPCLVDLTVRSVVIKMNKCIASDNLRIALKGKKVFLTLAAAIIFLLASSFYITGCSLIDNAGEYLYGKFSTDEEMNQAVEITGNFFNLLIEEDYRGAYQYISDTDKKKGSEQDFVDEFDNITKIVNVDINWVEVKGNTALLGIDLLDSYDGEEKMYKDIEVSLIKEEDGNWKIVFWE